MKISFLSAAIFLICALLLVGCNSNESKMLFDQVKWQSSKQCKPLASSILRDYMLEDVITKITVMNKSEVLDLLGPPDEFHDENIHLVYCLGKTNTLDLKWLVIEFEQNRYKTHRIRSGS